MDKKFDNLNNKVLSYFYGLFVSDGHYYEQSRSRGKIVIELSKTDSDILWRLKDVLPVKSTITIRRRITNYSNGSIFETCSLNIYDLSFRKMMSVFGMTSGPKADIAQEPIVDFSMKDFYRGIIDGDGSLGITSTGIPFLSLVTDSERLKDSYCRYLKEILGVQKNVHRNKRDEVYNICLFREDAVLFARHLYEENESLSMKRKYTNYQKMLKWVRTTPRKKRTSWTKEMDFVVRDNDIDSAAKLLGISVGAIKYRVWFLKHKV